MESLAQINPLDEAIAAFTVATNDVGVLNITASARYRALLDALRGHGDLDTARYAFAMEASLLESANKQWKLAADGLERLIALDVQAHPETGEHRASDYKYTDGTLSHPNCACDGADLLREGAKPFEKLTPFRSLPFPEPSMADMTRGNNSGFGDDL